MRDCQDGNFIPLGGGQQGEWSRSTSPGLLDASKLKIFRKLICIFGLELFKTLCLLSLNKIVILLYTFKKCICVVCCFGALSALNTKICLKLLNYVI